MRIGLLMLLSLAWAPAAFAETPRELLIAASFHDTSSAIALKHIDLAQGAATDALRRAPADYEAALMQAMAIGYRSKLTGSRAEALDARRRFEVLVRRDPANADAQIALGAWHLGAVNRLGKFVGRAALGAQQPLGWQRWIVLSIWAGAARFSPVSRDCCGFSTIRLIRAVAS